MKVYKNGVDHIPDGAVYVGRGTPFGNPFRIGRDGTREQVIAKFQTMVDSNPKLQQSIKTCLRGKDLICHCSPLPCHADILLAIANG